MNVDDDIVKKWAEAMRHETDLITRTMWSLTANYSLRAHQVYSLKCRNILKDDAGNPVAMVDGYQDHWMTTPSRYHCVPRYPPMSWAKRRWERGDFTKDFVEILRENEWGLAI